MKKQFIQFALIFVVGFNILNYFASVTVKAQRQDFEFSGSKAESYQCINSSGGVYNLVDDPDNPSDVFAYANESDAASHIDVSGRFVCPDIQIQSTVDENGDGVVDASDTVTVSRHAILKPPKLQQLEVWFFRILYVIWALIASMSFFFLVVLGYKYMLTRGDVTKITEIRQKIINYIIGLALVFLAVPIISTVFRFLSINDDVQCYDVAMPGFQFFFNDLCTDPNNVRTNPCDITDLAGGVVGRSYACPVGAAPVTCPALGTCFVCSSGGTWELGTVIGGACP